MLLKSAKIINYKSIEDSGLIEFDPNVTVLVGQNEAGKTAVLESLEKTNSIAEKKFVVTDDYPRRKLIDYQKRHATKPEIVVQQTYELHEEEIEKINTFYKCDLIESLQVTYKDRYDNDFSASLSVPEGPVAKALSEKAASLAPLGDALKEVKTVRQLIDVFSKVAATAEAKAYLQELQERFKPSETKTDNLVMNEVYNKFVTAPMFFYFDDYYLLPGKVNLQELSTKAANPPQQTEQDKTVLSLLRLAGIQINELLASESYETMRSRLEAISIKITDKIFEYWTQNQELEVEFDIKPDAKDVHPFNQGNNLYIRIKNKKHRVTVPFSQRSKGFIWFFSFIVWFDTVKEQNPNKELILLLDEPGLSLHALAQSDLLRYIDYLSDKHQIIYTTHSPFMIHNDRLHQARVVEDRVDQGTVISDNLSGSNSKTIFPLQAALGYTIAQNLFINKRNLLVEGPADLVYLRYVSNILDGNGKTVLRDDLSIVPVGGLDKVATFVALLGANQLELVVLHDYSGAPDQRIQSLVQQKVLKDKRVVTYADFRGKPGPCIGTDIEDLFEVSEYVPLFNETFKKKLPSPVMESDLKPGDRIIQRITNYLDSKSINLRSNGGFNHFAVADTIVTSPPKKLSTATLGRFEALFKSINALFSRD
jgi:predicted ATP-dependent endonuclease of OLD family